MLTRFRGEMTLLDGRGKGGSDAGEDEYGGSRASQSFGRSSPMERRPAAAGSGSGGGGGRMAETIDDDIPF